MKETKGSSEKVSSVVRAIDEVAFQNNILALNAALMAAQSGDVSDVPPGSTVAAANRCGPAFPVAQNKPAL